MDEGLIPIDIQCNKLVDWLIDRRHCNIKWQMAAEVVKNKIANALHDMPSSKEMKDLLEGSCFHYFKCRKIVDVLKDTEKDSKNIFGMYSSKRMKDWQEIVKLYEKENLNLAELSSRLLRNLNYEIPALKRHISKCSQVQEECRKKIQDCTRNTSDVQRRYAVECKKVGIEGDNVRKELMNLVSDLPKEFDLIAHDCKGLVPVLEYYAAFVEFSLSSDTSSTGICPMNRHLSTLGNSTVYQWRYGALPDRVVARESIDSSQDHTLPDDGEIDWGLTAGDETTSSDVIDFDIDVNDLGIVLENSGDDAMDRQQDNGFEIVLSEEAPSWQIEEVSIKEVPNGDKLTATEKVAEGDEALSLLECLETRTLFINELMELTGFLNQRLVETQRDTDVLSMNQFQSAPPILQLTSATELDAMHTQVSSIHEKLTSTKMQHLCRILDSPRFVDRLADTLSRQLSLTNKYQALKSSLEETIKSSQIEEASLYPKLNFLINETKEWKKLIEDDISKRYKGRPVHLMGSINML